MSSLPNSKQKTLSKPGAVVGFIVEEIKKLQVSEIYNLFWWRKSCSPTDGEYHHIPVSIFYFSAFVIRILTAWWPCGCVSYVNLVCNLARFQRTFHRRDSRIEWSWHILFHGIREVHYQWIMLVMLCAFYILLSAIQKCEMLFP